MLQDILYGLRMLAKKPAFTAMAAISLALGIGANTTIFSMLHGTLLGTLNFPESDRLVQVSGFPNQRPNVSASLNAADYRLLVAQNHSYQQMGAMYVTARNLGASGTDGSPAESLSNQNVTASLFQVLGVPPRLGRVFTAEEDRDNAPARVVVLTDRFWQRHFNADPDIVGKTMTLDSVTTTIVGVMPPGFDFFADDTDIFSPAGFSTAQLTSTARFVAVVARLKRGVSLQQAHAETSALGVQYAAAYPERDKNWSLKAESLHKAYFRGMEQPLLVLQGSVIFVLLIACVNVANLLLARASSRRAEVAIRTALGAGRTRIIRQLLTESLLLALAGGLLGAFLGWGGLKLFLTAMPQGAPGVSQIRIDGVVLAFTAGISILTGLIFGVVPALQGSRTDLTGTLKESGRGAQDGATRHGFRSALVALQIALSLVLLIGAGLMINSFLRLERNELGADPTNLLTFEFRFPQNQMMKQVGRFRGVGLWEIFPSVDLTYDRVLERVRSLPGVQSAAMATAPPMTGRGMGMNFRVEGKPAPANDAERQALNAMYLAISPNYFATLRIPLVRGRDFNDQDKTAAAPVIVVNQTFANRYLPNQEPLGQRVTLDFVPNEQPREIVGVVADSRVSRYQRDPIPTIYVPHVQQTVQWQGPSWNARAAMTFILKSNTDPMGLANAVRHAVSEIDASKPAGNLKTVEQYLYDQVRGPRLYMLLLGVFGAVAVILAAVGIYGIMTYAVAQRTHEIGVRMALGAGRSNILGMVIRRALLLIAIGIAAGVGGAYGLTRFLASDLWGVTPTDPPTFIAVSCGLAAVAMVACFVPTRRAVRVDPTVALRYE